jgi:hypothetical protein
MAIVLAETQLAARAAAAATLGPILPSASRSKQRCTTEFHARLHPKARSGGWLRRNAIDSEPAGLTGCSQRFPVVLVSSKYAGFAPPPRLHPAKSRTAGWPRDDHNAGMVLPSVAPFKA